MCSQQCPDSNCVNCRGKRNILIYYINIFYRRLQCKMLAKRESPYNSNVILLLSVIDSKLLQIDFTLFVRSMHCKEK